MGNKVLSFGNKTDSKKSSEIYTDIDMKPMQENIMHDKLKVSRSINDHAVFGALDNIFSWIQGERVLFPEFGSRLRMLLYQGINKQTEQEIVAEIHSCVSKWEPRVQISNITNISTVEDTEDNTIQLEIQYQIDGLPEQYYTYTYKYNR